MARALVMSGGGSKGAYGVGVAKVLMNEGGLDFDVVCGTSTGGLVAPFVVANRIDLAETFYTSVRTEDILTFRSTSQILKASSLASYRPLYLKIQEVVGDIGAAVRTSSSQLFITATRLQDRNPVFFHTGVAPHGTDALVLESIPDDETLTLAMLATASVPGIAPPVDIGEYQYVDGGVRENTPLAIPVAMGIDEIWVILLSPQTSPIEDKRYNTLLAVLGRTADTLTTDVSQHDVGAVAQAAELEKLFEGAANAISHDTTLTAAQVREYLVAANPRLGALAGAAFHVIGPAEPLTDNVMDFKPAKMQEMLARGEADARVALGGG
jgi:predicted acylesterase/phospholipase RssA